jgi:hypothetical protein
MTNIKRARLLALAAAGATAAAGFTQQAARAASGSTGAAINVMISRSSDGDSLKGDAANLTVEPMTYTPALTSIPVAPGATYDAADTADSGTQWNVLLTPPTAVQVNGTGAVVTIVFQKNIPLSDSTGTATPAKLNVLYLEAPDKSNGIHSAALPSSTGTDADGLEVNPKELIKTSWIAGSTAEQIEFQLTGLTPNQTFDLFIYGAGKNGNGGTFTIADPNQGSGYNKTEGAYTTEPTEGSVYHSVFGGKSGIDPKPEEGKTWLVLPAQADGQGSLAFFVNHHHGTKIKGSINGFQLQPAAASTTEPTSSPTTAPTTSP